MGKRKKKSVEKSEVKRLKTKSDNADPNKAKEIFTSIEFVQMLQDPVLYVKGIYI